MGWKQNPMCQRRIDRLLLIRQELERWWICRSIHNKGASAHHQNCGCPCGWDYQPVSRFNTNWVMCNTCCCWAGTRNGCPKVVGHSSQAALHSEHVYVFPVSWFNPLSLRFLQLHLYCQPFEWNRGLVLAYANTIDHFNWSQEHEKPNTEEVSKCSVD